MLRLLADENFNGIVYDELLRQQPDLDLVRAQDVGLMHAPDPVVLDWAAAEGRTLLSHDKKTMPRYVYERITHGLPVAGVIELLPPYTVLQAVEDVLIVAVSVPPDQMRNRIIYLPL